MRSSVDLPAPFSPNQHVAAARFQIDGDLAQGSEGAKEFGDLIEPAQKVAWPRRSSFRPLWRARSSDHSAAAGLVGWERCCRGAGVAGAAAGLD